MPRYRLGYRWRVGQQTTSVTVENSPPVIDTHDSTKFGIVVGTKLTCEATATDINGGTPAITYAWSNTSGFKPWYHRNIHCGLGRHLSGRHTPLTAVATDTDGGRDTSQVDVSLGNSAPTVNTVTIASSESGGQTYNTSTLTCSATATDPDGGTPTLSYEWFNATTSIGRGDTVTLTSTTATPGDRSPAKLQQPTHPVVPIQA